MPGSRPSPPVGIEPAERETYGNGVRKVIYRDPDGNEIGYGGGQDRRPHGGTRARRPLPRSGFRYR